MNATGGIEQSRILIVDDEPANVRLLERMLSRTGYSNIVTTEDPRQVEALFLEQEPDLILLDLHMPYVDGFEVMRRIREMTPPGSFVPILVLTADATSRTRLQALSDGANDFLNKPFDKSEVILRAGNLLRMRHLHLQVQSQNERLEEMVQQRTLELQRALRKLEATQQQVIQQERLHALGLMASGVAHDFNNALSVILGYSELSLLECKKLPSGNEVSEHLQTIVTAAADAAEMVTRLREFYRPRSHEESDMAIDLNALVDQAVHLTRPKWRSQTLGRGVQIEVKTDFGIIPLIAGDAAELREVMTNVIFNAVDAMPAGGAISFRTHRENGQVALEVSDTGVGMDEEVRRRCLEPFFTTKGKRGTGMGLAMVYGIIERHKGSMEIRSEPGKGTTIVFRLPPHTNAVQNKETVVAKLERPLKILVVDDQPILCKIVSDYLEHDWHTVDTAIDGRDALDRFKGDRFDLIVTDQAMPEMTGQQLAAAVKEIAPETPVIMLTGFGECDEGANAVIDYVLSKPVSQIDLRRAIVRVMTA